MLEGWTISGVWAVQGRFPWSSVDKVRTDWVGTGESSNTYSPSPNDGVQQFWNYTGPHDAFNIDRSRLTHTGRARMARAQFQV